MKSPLSPTLRAFCRAILLGAALSFAIGVAQNVSAAPETADSALRDPAKNSAIRPEPRDPKWVKRHEGFVQEAKQGGVDVLFLGDSITDFWRDQGPKRGGRAVWDREFAPLHAANFGISGDRTQHLLWRLENGELDGIHPKVIVLMIGTNNTGFETGKSFPPKTPRNTPAETVEGVREIVQLLRTKEPQANILLLAVFPRGEKPDFPQRLQVNEINQHIQSLADGRHVFWLDLGPKFLQPDGTLPDDIMPDHLHPSQKGYEIWAAAMKPTLLKLLNGK